MNKIMENLKNNSESMKTVVETFLIEETVDLIYDNEKLERWNNIVAELGLEGQKKITKGEKSPIPFMYLKECVKQIFTTLCPIKVPIREFNTTPIPLEILDLIALSEKEQYFSAIQIWYDDKKPDPVCVGIVEHWILHVKGTYDVVKDSPTFTTKKDAENYALVNNILAEPYHYSWSDLENYYLIGKWADVKRPIEELKQIAIARYIDDKGNELKKQIKEAQRKLDDVELDASILFN
jgi:hypothetical protein